MKSSGPRVALSWRNRSGPLLIALGCLVAGTDSSFAGEPVRVVPEGAVREPQQPQVAVAPDGTIYVVYGSGPTIYCSVSSDGGRSFGRPAKVGGAPTMALGMRRGPRVAATKQAVVVTAVCGQVGRGQDGDIWCWRSIDRGATWRESAHVNDSPASAREGLHGMAAGPKDELFCTWLDLRHRKTELYGARSTDGGATWSANQLVYESPSGSICECCHPSALFDGRGVLYVMWRNQVSGNRDMYLARSDDSGRTFGPAAKLGDGTWALDACPMDGGSLAADPRGNLVTTWMRNGEVFTAAPDQPEKQVGRGYQPFTAFGTKGAYVLWQTGKHRGELRLLAPGRRQPTTLAREASWPAAAQPIEGAAAVAAVWESGTAQGRTIMATVLD
jgi:hypothetical protein